MSVALLCHDELANLPRVLDALERALAPLASAEILVVDDGSTDGTSRWLARHRGPIPLRVVRHERRRGYGAAVRSGLTAARGERVGWMDGDGQFDPSQITELLSALDAGADIAAGIRADRRDGPHRRLIGAVYNAGVRAALGVRWRDMDCGFKVMTRDAALALGLQCDGNLIGPELYVKARAAGLCVRQIPVRHRPREQGRPKGIDPFALIHTARELVERRRDLWPRRDR